MSDPIASDTLRISGRELDLLIADLERESGTAPTNIRRELKRWTFTGGKALMTIISGAGNTRHYVVAPRNISAGGVAMLHGGFVHPGTKCIVSMRCMDRSVQSISGQVARCSHLRGHLHDLGVRFNERVDPERFVDFQGQTAFNLEQVDLSKLQGSLLVVEDSLADQRLLAHYFRASNLEINFAKDAEQGLAMLGDTPDLIFVDYQLPTSNGIEFIQAAKSAGFSGPMILVTGDCSPGLRDRARGVGAAELLLKPCPKELLHQAAAEYMLESGSKSARGHGRISASAAQIGLTLDILEQYVDDLRRHSDAIHQCLADSKIDELRQIAVQIKGSASGHGFDPIGQAAADLLRSLNATMSVQESAGTACRLSEYCRRAKAQP